jgi:membrane-bound lytic murein transglycosylase D
VLISLGFLSLFYISLDLLLLKIQKINLLMFRKHHRYVFIISSFILFFSTLCYSSSILGNPQATNTPQVQQADTTVANGANPDSVTAHSLKMIDNPSEAQKIVNESETNGMLDSLNCIPYFQDYLFTTDTSLLNTYNFPVDLVPTYDDETYRQRIEKLSQTTPIDLTYNQTVKTYIELYAVKKRKLTSKILGLKEIYFPLIEEYLDKYDIPLELKYLAVVESALNPVANSRAGAKGLWQFMYNTGKLYGLKSTSLIDDRFDPYLATDAACRHLKDLYAMYGDWNLVMAAYNSGAGNVNKAIRRAGGTRNYWAIWPFLPAETRGYVPAFIAVMYVMSYAPEHNLYPLHPGILYNGIDTVVVRQPLSFDQITEMLNVPMEDLRFLNPIFKTNLIPAYNGKTYSLRLPTEYITAFVDNEEALYNYKSKSGLEKEKILVEIKKASDRTVHVVRKGESLGLIAKKYNISVNQLKQWNGMKGTTIYPGQKLTVYPPSSYTTSTSSSKSATTTAEKSVADSDSTKTSTQGDDSKAKATAKEAPANPTYHIVKSGDNLAAIASRYGCTVDQIRSWNNLKNNTIYPKQKLIVSGSSTEVAEKKTTPASTSKTSSASKTSDDKIVYYTVKKGDTLWDIAQQYKGVTVQDIQKLNNLKSSSRLQPGQKLKISVSG